MAVCVGCGLEVNAGILEVNPCSDRGIDCFPGEGNGCIGIVNDYFGCGIRPITSGKGLEIDVQGQAVGTTVPLATAKSQCLSPNCNGLVCTDEGLWAPTKLTGSCYFAQAEDFVSNVSISDYLIDFPGDIPDLDASLSDNLLSPRQDFIVGDNPNAHVFAHSAINPDPLCDLNGYGNTFGTFYLSFFVKAGEVWRFLLWERGDFITTKAEAEAPGTMTGSSLLGTGFTLQASFYVDNRNRPAGIYSVQMNDVSTHCEFNTRWEMLVTASRQVGNGPLDNLVTRATKQYRRTTTSSHCQLPVASRVSDGSLQTRIP